MNIREIKQKLKHSSEVLFAITYWVNLILAVLFLFLLVKVFCGTKSPFLFVIALLNLIACITYIFAAYFEDVWNKAAMASNSETFNLYASLYIIMLLVSSVAYQVSYWIFAFKYWKMSI